VGFVLEPLASAAPVSALTLYVVLTVCGAHGCEPIRLPYDGPPAVCGLQALRIGMMWLSHNRPGSTLRRCECVWGDDA
jgi:hypothetical protein